MRRTSRWNDDGGAAAVEFLLVGLVLLVPIVYLVLALGQIQSGALAAEAMARQLARGIAASPDAVTAEERSRIMTRAIADEYGIDGGSMEVSVTCRPVAHPCPGAGATLRVVVRVDVTLPLVPDILGMRERAAVSVEATSVQKVSRRGGAP